ncbi:MAG: alternative ribosome rescue aminoacyl-tRNA hydrolase ArfB [Candidatus Zhuqueibacterota bacterium]
MIEITDTLKISDDEISEEFVRSSGPGGQNVNKVATAVLLRFNVRHSPSLPDEVRERLIRLAGKRLNENGEIVIKAQRFRSQLKNREDALQRLIGLIRKATHVPAVRRSKKPSAAVRARRMADKRKRSEIKHLRKFDPGSDD